MFVLLPLSTAKYSSIENWLHIFPPFHRSAIGGPTPPIVSVGDQQKEPRPRTRDVDCPVDIATFVDR